MYQILLAIGILISVLIFFNQSNKQSAVRYLAAYFLSAAFTIYLQFLFRTSLHQSTLLFIGLGFLLLLATPGVFAFFYITTSIGINVRHKWLHFVPVLLMLLNFCPLLLATTAAQEMFLEQLNLNHTLVFNSPFTLVPTYLLLLFRVSINLLYIFYIFKWLLKAYQQKIALNYLWFFSFTALNALVVAVVANLIHPFFYRFIQPSAMEASPFSPLFQYLYILFLGIFLFALFFPKIIYEKLFLNRLTSSKITNLPEQKTVVLTEIQSDAITKKIADYITDKPYLCADFSKAQLLVDTQISWHLLSAYLVDNHKTSFSHWKSELQIMESISMVQEGYLKKHTIASLSSAVGFQSRSRFTVLFKQYAGCTPKELAKRF